MSEMQGHRSLATEDEVKWLGKIYNLLLQLVASNKVLVQQVGTDVETNVFLVPPPYCINKIKNKYAL